MTLAVRAKIPDSQLTKLVNPPFDLRIMAATYIGQILEKNVFNDQNLDWVLDAGVLPHFVIRQGIRWQLQKRLQIIQTTSLEQACSKKQEYVAELRRRPIAIETAKANEQHYEVSSDFIQACLGPRMKYSCCLYETPSTTLAEAEDAMLELYMKRAELGNGMRILDLGCGWGSASLFIAKRYPKSKVVAFSNSTTQKAYIDKRASERGLSNVQVVTGDIVTHDFQAAEFDRVVSIELFEHMKNYELLMRKTAHALKPQGKAFIHMFTHKDTPYDFDGGWMTTHFFTGGTMPSADLLLYFQRDLSLEKQWWVNGSHYARTCEDWLVKMVRSRSESWAYLQDTYGKEDTARWWQRWQIFYLACAELFAYQGGDTWGVSHYLFTKDKAVE